MYLATLALSPEFFSPATKAAALRMFFAFGVGPLGGSVLLLGNSLVPHSIDYMASLLIHLSPHLAAFCLRWHDKQRGTWFPVEQVGLGAYARPPLTFLACWALLHASLMLCFGAELRAAGWNTTYHYNLQARGGRNMFARTLGEIGSGGSEVRRFLLYELISVALNAVVILATYPLYAYGTPSVHFALLFATGLVTTWNGASWYSYRLTNMTRAVDKLLSDHAKDN